MAKKKRAVDIFTDAGVVDGRGSWAAVIVRCDGRGGIVEDSGLFRGWPVDSYAGEAQAIANAFHLAKQTGMIEPGEKVVVRCDHMDVVKRFKGVPIKKKLRTDLKRARSVARKLIAEIGCKVQFSHIKAHRDLSNGSMFTIMNARADHLCCVELGNSRKDASARGVTDGQIETYSAQLKLKYRNSSARAEVAKLTGAG